VSGDRLILLHGAAERGALFNAVLPLLHGFDVVAPDRAGHGARWHEGPGTLAGDASDLVALLDGGPAVVVGHSIGGLGAIGAALAVPGRVRALGLYETAVPWAPWWTDEARDAMWRETEASVARAEEIDPSNPSRDRVRMAWATCRDEVAEAFDGPFDWEALTVPLTTGHGAEGTRASARDAALVAARFGTESVVLDGAGHRAPKTDPEAFAGFVRGCVQHARR
jgi:pimeloyl-ACP methyl ester carboxylesterase